MLATAEFFEFLRQLAGDGLLPKWSEWWGPGAMEALVPDAGQRSAVVAGLPELPSHLLSRLRSDAERLDGTQLRISLVE